jgi:L-ornithine Nalpha-acyltransferase
MQLGVRAIDRRTDPSTETHGGVCRPEILGRIGNLEIRLARPDEIEQAQLLRGQVFQQQIEGGLTHDADAFDPLCDHLIVEDRASGNGAAPVVGTYRLLRGDVAAFCGGFYSAAEFEIEHMLRRHRGLRFLELGRSCVMEAYRTRRTIELLWHGIWAYARRHQIDVMFGCASLPGIDLHAHRATLAFLHHTAAAPPEWCVRAQPGRRVAMDALTPSDIDQAAAFRSLPPLVKGYLRLGAYVGDGACVDYAFGTTDVIMILPVSRIEARYLRYFGVEAERHAA